MLNKEQFENEDGMRRQQEIKQIDEELREHEFLTALEASWRKSLPRLTDTEWLELFPEARDVFPDKIKEWEIRKGRWVDIAKRALRESTAENGTEISLYLRVRVMSFINAAERHIARLQRQMWHSAGRPAAGGRITEADIQRARGVPITSLIPPTARRSGKTITTNCPLHDDRSPSFVIYLETNSCWCFGCQQGGDSIALTRLLHGLSFIETVKYLQHL